MKYDREEIKNYQEERIYRGLIIPNEREGTCIL